MNNHIAKVVAKQVISLSTRTCAFVGQRSLAAFSTLAQRQQAEQLVQQRQVKVPEEAYCNGHLMSDRLEYLDDVLERTVSIESTLQDLKDTYARKRQAYHEAASLEEMEKLFLQAECQKQEISLQIANLKAILLSCKATPFAVDGPDGTADACERTELNEINNLIDDAAAKEDTAHINKVHQLKQDIAKDRARDPEHDW